MRAYTNTDAAKPVWGYLEDLVGTEEFVQVSENALTYTFPERNDRFYLSMGACHHWMELAFASQFDQVNYVLEKYGAVFAGTPPNLERLLFAGSDFVYVTRDGELFQMYTPPADSPHKADYFDVPVNGLISDRGFVPFSELEEDNFEDLAPIVESKRCPCSMCTMLRPEESYEHAMCESLQSNDPEVIESAIWYLSNAASPLSSLVGKNLVARIGISDETNESIAMMLFNSYLNQSSVPQWVIDAFVAINSQGGSGGELAAWALPILREKAPQHPTAGPSTKETPPLPETETNAAATIGVRPIVRSGDEDLANVVDVQFSKREAAGINYFMETLTLETSSGETLHASIEESDGTDLPEVELGAGAIVWSLDGRTAVATSGALFEGTQSGQ